VEGRVGGGAGAAGTASAEATGGHADGELLDHVTNGAVELISPEVWVLASGEGAAAVGLSTDGMHRRGGTEHFCIACLVECKMPIPFPCCVGG
jgi:hypothetical protein